MLLFGKLIFFFGLFGTVSCFLSSCNPSSLDFSKLIFGIGPASQFETNVEGRDIDTLEVKCKFPAFPNTLLFVSLSTVDVSSKTIYLMPLLNQSNEFTTIVYGIRVTDGMMVEPVKVPLTNPIFLGEGQTIIRNEHDSKLYVSGHIDRNILNDISHFLFSIYPGKPSSLEEIGKLVDYSDEYAMYTFDPTTQYLWFLGSPPIPEFDLIMGFNVTNAIWEQYHSHSFNLQTLDYDFKTNHQVGIGFNESGLLFISNGEIVSSIGNDYHSVLQSVSAIDAENRRLFVFMSKEHQSNWKRMHTLSRLRVKTGLKEYQDKSDAIFDLVQVHLDTGKILSSVEWGHLNVLPSNLHYLG